MDNDKDLEIEVLRDALDHIRRTALGSRTQSRRLQWIASRADSALNDNNDWKDLDLPKSSAGAIQKLRARVKQLETMVDTMRRNGAKIPIGDLSQFVPVEALLNDACQPIDSEGGHCD